MINILAISGSLRKASSNTILLKAMAELAPADVSIQLYQELANLPIFNPDLEGQEPPVVLDFYQQVNNADGLLIASPEYAHGVTGVIKNALDWLVGGINFMGKPVALPNASARATVAQSALIEILTTMGGNIVEAASPCSSLDIPFAGQNINQQSLTSNPVTAEILSNAMTSFITEIRQTNNNQWNS